LTDFSYFLFGAPGTIEVFFHVDFLLRLKLGSRTEIPTLATIFKEIFLHFTVALDILASVI